MIDKRININRKTQTHSPKKLELGYYCELTLEENKVIIFIHESEI